MFSLRLSCFILLIACVFSCKEKTPPPRSQGSVSPVIKGSDERIRQYNLDKSPMDIIYLPEDFPVAKMSGSVSGLPVARLIYSRPSKDGRTIFGNVVRYGTYWRLGANEGTEIEFFTDVTINSRRVRKGRYIIYCIPYENKWTIKLNDDLFAWGLRIHSSRDVYSFDIPITRTNSSIEILTMKFQEANEGGELLIGWDSVKASLPFKY